jgi:RNA-binding protein
MDFRSLQISIRLGKNGLTKGLIQEMKSQLKKKKMIKCKFLKSYPFDVDRKKDSERIAYILNAELVNIKGFVFVLRKKEKTN